MVLVQLKFWVRFGRSQSVRANGKVASERIDGHPVRSLEAVIDLVVVVDG